MLSVLFLCTANAARSQLAEALVNQRYAEHFVAYSAGTQPKGIDPRTIKHLQAQGLSSSGLRSKTITELEQDIQQQTQRPALFNFIITLCDSAKQECALLPNSAAILHWNLPDPAEQQGLALFEQVFADLELRLAEFVRFNHNPQAALQIEPIDVFKQFSDNTRLQILMLIEDEQRLSVNQLCTALEVSQPKVSRHLALLRECQLLSTTRQGQQVFYHLNPLLPEWVAQTLSTTRVANPSYINQPLTRIRQPVNTQLQSQLVKQD
ncbi:metalloregulator ArsR/SmtB family transcription factor [Agarivorans sp. Alg241-V36]|uniref:metalloregulator ArsR/SmtB family transcription factor n=1 Tax=Agarivorans sp. Alg241-V36 TaxID=2305992 RepID=UPI0013CF7E8A|nr:metalloregulator ArsR/SmtB family transcription factor [Agarivorans sp. Alg241-V36]